MNTLIPTAHPEAQLFNQSLFAVDPLANHELAANIGRKCYVRQPKGASPKWGIEVNGIMVQRAPGEEVVCGKYVDTLPGDEPQVYTIAHLQKAWGHNAEGKYVPDCIAYRVLAYEGDFGRPAKPSDVIFVD